MTDLLETAIEAHGGLERHAIRTAWRMCSG
jgi:hypothetical protein